LICGLSVVTRALPVFLSYILIILLVGPALVVSEQMPSLVLLLVGNNEYIGFLLVVLYEKIQTQ
jgi:hypothetical protein